MKRRRWDAPKQLTPLRALPLLRQMTEARVADNQTQRNQALDAARDSLEEHVKFGLEQARRRKRRKKKS